MLLFPLRIHPQRLTAKYLHQDQFRQTRDDELTPRARLQGLRFIHFQERAHTLRRRVAGHDMNQGWKQARQQVFVCRIEHKPAAAQGHGRVRSLAKL
jgi:hypothetical protein